MLLTYKDASAVNPGICMMVILHLLVWLGSTVPPSCMASYYLANRNKLDAFGARNAFNCVLIRTVCLQLFPLWSHTYVVHLGKGPGVHSTQMMFPKTLSLPQLAPGRSSLPSCGTTPWLPGATTPSSGPVASLYCARVS